MKIRRLSLCSHSLPPRSASRFVVFGALAVIFWALCAAGQQPAVPRLTLAQVEQLVSSKVPDSTLNTQIQRRGVAFTPTPAMIESLRAKGAGPLTLAAIETFFPKATLSLATSRDLIYMPSHQGLGLIELSVAEGALKRTAKTVLFNNTYVSWNVHQQEFYVVGVNGDAVSVISAETFTQTATMKGDVGWNTFSTALSPDGRSLYLACFGGSPQTLRIVVFDTASRSHRATQVISGGESAAYLALSPDGERVYVASGSVLAEYETSDLRLLRQQSFEGWPLIVSPDGRFLFSVQQDRLLRIRTDSLSVDKSLTLPEAAFKQLSLSRDGRDLFASGKNAIYRVPLSLDTYIPIRPPHGVDSGIQFTESTDGRALYVLSGGNNQESLWVIDLATEQVMKTIDGIAFPASIIAVPGALMREIPKRDDLPDASSNSVEKSAPSTISADNGTFRLSVKECRANAGKVVCTGEETYIGHGVFGTFMNKGAGSMSDDRGGHFRRSDAWFGGLSGPQDYQIQLSSGIPVNCVWVYEGFTPGSRTISLQFPNGIALPDVPLLYSVPDSERPGIGQANPTLPSEQAVVPKKVNISAGVAASLLLQKKEPVYPPIAKAARISGTVVLQATISETGSVEYLQVISGPAMLQSAALEAAKTWRYKPYLLNNKPVEVETTINVVFTLGG